MGDQGGHVPDDTPSVPGRSGDEVDDAVDRAAEGADGGGTLRPPERSHPGTAPVEQIGGDAGMTGGRGGGTGGHDGPPPTAPPPEAAISGGAQSDPGARASDRVAADEDDGTD